MTLKYEIESLDGLDENVQALYAEKDGKYVLDVEGVESTDSVAGLKSAYEKQMENRKEAEKQAKALQKQLDELQHGKAKDSGDLEALEKSWSEKLSKREAELTAEIEKLQSGVQKLTSGQQAMELASKIAVKGSETVLHRLIQDRLTTEYQDGEPKVIVLDKSGKRSAATLDDLEQELRADAALAPIIAKSQASGGGAARSNGAGPAKTMKRSDFEAMDGYAKAEFIQEGGKLV